MFTSGCAGVAAVLQGRSRPRAPHGLAGGGEGGVEATLPRVGEVVEVGGPLVGPEGGPQLALLGAGDVPGGRLVLSWGGGLMESSAGGRSHGEDKVSPGDGSLIFPI